MTSLFMGDPNPWRIVIMSKVFLNIKRIANFIFNIPYLKYEFEVHNLGNNKSIIVDLGCGTGQFLKSLKEKFPQHEYFGVDTLLTENISSDNLHLISGNLFDFVNTDTFQNSKMVILNSVIEHLGQNDITYIQ